MQRRATMAMLCSACLLNDLRGVRKDVRNGIRKGFRNGVREGIRKGVRRPDVYIESHLKYRYNRNLKVAKLTKVQSMVYTIYINSTPPPPHLN